MSLPMDWDADDESHPIPYLGRIDVLTETKEGSLYYGLVMAAPMSSDERSQRRLLKKLEDYISDRHGDENIERFGRPTNDRTHLTIAIHPGSDALVFELIEKCLEWLQEAGFSVEVTSEAKIFSLH